MQAEKRRCCAIKSEIQKQRNRHSENREKRQEPTENDRETGRERMEQNLLRLAKNKFNFVCARASVCV